jgi:hypothetical protein
MKQRAGEHAGKQLDTRTFRGAEAVSRPRVVVFGDLRRHQFEIQYQLLSQRRARPCPPHGAFELQPAQRPSVPLAAAALFVQKLISARSARAPCSRGRLVERRQRASGSAQAAVRRDRAAPSVAGRSRTQRLPLSLWRRRERRTHHLLRPSSVRRFKLLHAAFSSDARPHHQIDEAQYRGGRAFQDDWERAERGPQAVDQTREYVDGGRPREPITERQRKAVLRLNRAERELGADGSALVHEVLVLGLTMEQVGQRRALRGQRWIDYFARRFRECLDRLALIYGFATQKR